MKFIKKIMNALLVIIIIVALGFIGLIVYALISDYKPEEKVTITVNEYPSVISNSAELSLITWNIGYCGLDKEMDFFYDGGKKVFTPKENCFKNLSSILSFLKSNDSINFILLQEVDKKSKRSYRIDQYATLAEHLKTYSGNFATNYDVFFVPVPLSSPMGKVVSGISTFSKYKSSSSVRYAFPEC